MTYPVRASFVGVRVCGTQGRLARGLPSISDDWVPLTPQGGPAGEEQPWELNPVLFVPGPEFLPVSRGV